MNSETIVDILQRRALETPERLAYGFLKGGEELAEQLSYAELDRRARAVALRIRETTEPGDRVLLLFPAGLEFVVSFFGCLYAGATAVTGYVPKRSRPDFRIESIASDSSPSMVLTTAEIVSARSKLVERTPELAAIPWESINGWIVDDALVDQDIAPSSDPDGIALLQYTSGSTSTPKGVVVTHRNLSVNLAQLHAGWNHTENSVMVTWLPHFHDMGLVYGLLQPLYIGFPCYWMPPASFLQRPARWLEAITRYGGTHSAAPNFAYELCVRSIPAADCGSYDLSNWIMTLNAAEPVREETMRRFATHFSAAGFRYRTFSPGYGLAESTLKTTSLPADQESLVFPVDAEALGSNRVEPARPGEKSILQVGCGLPAGDTSIAIVDPNTCNRCDQWEIGEIWVEGETLAKGYWNKPDETRDTFQSTLSDGTGPYLRTGDLGFIHEGQVFVTGRLKELIIINGLNHYPHDIEATVQEAHDAFAPGSGAAFSISGEDGEKLALVQEVRRTSLSKFDPDELFEAARQAVSEVHGLELHAIVLLKPGGVQKTSSGKIRRNAGRDALLSGTLDSIGTWQRMSGEVGRERDPARETSEATSNEVLEWLIEVLSEFAKVPASQIDSESPFSTYGLGSVDAVRLSGKIQDRFHLQVAASLLYDHPTANALANYLSSRLSGTSGTNAIRSQEMSRFEAVAVVGMACRFPGSDSPEDFYRGLLEGIDHVTPIPAERWDAEEFFHPSPTRGKMYIKECGFLDNVDGFDARFFGISPREAACMDPQQRLALEVAWEALERSLIRPDELAGTRTGVFIGSITGDYETITESSPDVIEQFAATGVSKCIIANRISYAFDLKGPSLTVDTACSSSLVSVHLACQSLASGESDVAIAGGTNLILSPEVLIILSQAKMLSPDARCKPFSSDANGYIRGEGVGMIVLKRLADAERDGDNVLAVIRGSAVNQDGQTNGLSAPNGIAQREAIQSALNVAGVNPNDIGYVETHGTGTSLGDPIEFDALRDVLASNRDSENPCWLGALKSSIGHLEGAAGIAGLIKCVMVLQNGRIPGNLHFRSINPEIPLDETPFRIPTQTEEWISDRPRIAGVSSFGFGGTNAHMIIEQASEPVPEPAASAPLNQYILTFSARSGTALQRLAGKYADSLEECSDEMTAPFCNAAARFRTAFDERAAVTGKNRKELVERLRRFSAPGTAAPTVGIVSGKAPGKAAPSTAFLFTGQGSQYPGMGKELYDGERVFRTEVDRCDKLLEPLIGESIKEIMFQPDGGRIDQTAFTQPALFTLEYALSQLWRSWGVTPSVVVGHSVGEYTAACIAGVFGLEEGLELISTRARLMQALPAGGSMAAVFASESDVSSAINGAGAVAVAVVNGPANTVISGPSDRVQETIEKLRTSGFDSTRLSVSHAFHSPLMKPMLESFRATLSTIDFREPRIPLICNRTGKVARDRELDQEYWLAHILEPVRFYESVLSLAHLEPGLILEIGPHPVLLGMASSCLSRTASKSKPLIPSLRRNRGDFEQIFESLGAVYVQGQPVSLDPLSGPARATRVTLPTYPFEHKRYWLPTDTTSFASSKHGAQSEVERQLENGDIDGLLEVASGQAGNGGLEVLRDGLKALVNRHRKEKQLGDVRDWFYGMQWIPAPDNIDPEKANGENGPNGSGTSGTTLILTDGGNLGQALTESFDRLGLPVRTAADLDAARQALVDHASLERVVLMWPQEIEIPEDAAQLAPYADKAHDSCVRALLVVAQALAGHQVSAKIWVITRGAQAVSENEPVKATGVMQSPVWGFARCFALEHPDQWGGILDLDPNESSYAGDAERIIQAILTEGQEDEIAFRNHQAFNYRVVRSTDLLSSHPKHAATIRSDVSYLITGGTGALGIATAYWLADRGATEIILTGRRGFTPEMQPHLDAFKERQVQLQVMKADVTEPDSMAALFDTLRESVKPLRGIIHAAGVPGVKPLLYVDEDLLSDIMAPAVHGTLNLHDCTRDMKLDFFVNYASIAGIIGSKGQTHYASGNHFQDIFAYYRRAQGHPCSSIAWGPWAEGGMTTTEIAELLVTIGMKTIKPASALKALDCFLESGAVQNAVVDVDWSLLCPVFHGSGHRALFDELYQIDQDAIPVENIGSDIMVKLGAALPAERESELSTYIQSQVSRFLGFDEPEDAELDKSVFQLGMDSLLAVSLRNVLSDDLGTALSPTIMFEHPTIRDLSEHLTELLWAASEGSADVPIEAEDDEVEIEFEVGEEVLEGERQEVRQ